MSKIYPALNEQIIPLRRNDTNHKSTVKQIFAHLGNPEPSFWEARVGPDRHIGHWWPGGAQISTFCTFCTLGHTFSAVEHW